MRQLMRCGVIGYLLFCLTGCEWNNNDKLFKSLDPEDTGIDFSNRLTYSDSLTVLEFEYMYNGAGVAVADINSDGLQDIYFTGNMVSSALFLNLGDWQFEDVTESAGVGTRGWANGVAMVDVDQDGLKDIYVCLGGPRGTTPDERANLLFINNGDGTFTESAANYGLADTEYSVQAAFFDYDKDSDLDVYLLSNALVNFNRNTSRPKELTGKAPSVDKLYRNNGDNTFTDVSEQAGILIEGFGLGVEICDINNDNWPDIYVSNDFLTDDLLYINQQDGTFSNQAGLYLKHQTYNGMGNDLADFNNDGLLDIVVLDMFPEDNRRRKLTMMGNNYDEFHTGLSYGYQPQYIRNTLQLNHGPVRKSNGTKEAIFSEIGQLAGIDATDWSWSALLADYDNDGWKDLLVTNGYRQDITNLDFMVYGRQVSRMGTPEAIKKQRLDMLNELPGIKIPNYIYKNLGDLTFEDVTEKWGLGKPTYSNGAVYADLDNDGDLDLVINNIDNKAGVYQNRANKIKKRNYLRIGFAGPQGNREGLGAKVFLKHNGQIQYQYFTPFRGYLSSVEPYLHFGLEEVTNLDTLKVIWTDGKQQLLTDLEANQELILRHEAAVAATEVAGDAVQPTVFKEISEPYGIHYRHRENEFVDFKVQPLLPHMHSRNGPGLAVADIDNDGLEDFYVGGATGYPGGLFTQQPDGKFVKVAHGLDTASEDMGTLFFDADNDGDQDFYIVSGGSAHVEGSSLYKDRLYLNDGKGRFEQAVGALPDLRESGSCIVAADYDRDGDLDLFVGGRVVPGSYPLSPKSCLLRNETVVEGDNRRVIFEEATREVAPALVKAGMVTAGLWTDFNGDGWVDLLVAGEFMPLRFFKNQQGRLVEVTDDVGLAHTSGWWNSLVGGDFDQDGDTDYLAGNLGLNSRYHATPEQPLCIYASDYDKNGRIDPVMCYYNQGKNYLAHSRDDIIEQINAMRARFRTYSDYAEATFEESFLPEELSQAYVVRSERFASSYIENLGQGKFAMRSLPVEAQLSPVYGMTTGDFDLDGHMDVLLIGNLFSGEVSVGRYDASIGLFLRGDGTGNFIPSSVQESGFFVDGDAKGMAQITLGDGQRMILAANNSDQLKAFVADKKGAMMYSARPQDAFAIVTLKNGNIFRHEFYFGSTYLSHSSRSLPISQEMQKVVVYDFEGNSTELTLGI